MLRLALAILVALGAAQAEARTKKKHARPKAVFSQERFEHSLSKLGPEERLKQICDFAAMEHIRKEQPDYKPDRAVADAIIPAVIAKNTVVAAGGALRSNKKWYALSYNCTTSPDDMKAVAFSYKLGAEIPQEKWDGYGLWE